MIDDPTEEVLTEIFGRNSGWNADDVQGAKLSPGFPDVRSFAQLLAIDPDEEALQRFLTERPQFLLGMFGQGDDSDVGFLTKPRVGPNFADFALFNINQGGARVMLVELERSTATLFTEKGTPARTLQTAMGQVRDWHQWLTLNGSTFVRDAITELKTLPEFPDRALNGSFRSRSAEGIEQGWRQFGGYDDPVFRYAIVVGRWAKLSEEDQKRLLFLNKHDGNLHQIYTYDCVARRAYDRPAVWP